MVMMFADHIKNVLMNSKVFPFISLTLTPIIVLHIFTLDVKLAEVVKLLIKRLFPILTYDFFDLKSQLNGTEL